MKKFIAFVIMVFILLSVWSAGFTFSETESADAKTRVEGYQDFFHTDKVSNIQNNNNINIPVKTHDNAEPLVKTNKAIKNSYSYDPSWYDIDNQFDSSLNIVNLWIGKKVYNVNGMPMKSDVAPVIKNNRTLVPIRIISEGLGALVNWDGIERKVTIQLETLEGDKTVELFVGKKEYYIDGIMYTMDVPPQIINSRTMVPIRVVSESLDCKVYWDGTEKKVTVKAINLQSDADSDSLTFIEEYENKTDPNDPDTDDDGLLDGIEVSGWDITVNGKTKHVNSNPLKNDSDDDGIPDNTEYKLKTDPLNPETYGYPDNLVYEFHNFFEKNPEAKNYILNIFNDIGGDKTKTLLNAIKNEDSEKVLEILKNFQKTELTCVENPYKKLGDVNGDLIIDAKDLYILLNKIGTSDGICDVNGDGKIDISDFNVALQNLWQDFRLDDFDEDGIPNVVEADLGTDMSKPTAEELNDDIKDPSFHYLYQYLISNIKDLDGYTSIIVTKTIENAVGEYPFNVPPIKDNSVLYEAGKYPPTILRFFSKYDLLKGQSIQTGLEKLKKYVARNLTLDEVKLLYSLTNEDIEKLKTTKDLKEIDLITNSISVNLYISQIKSPDDPKTVEEMKELVRSVYANSSDLGKIILDKYVLQALMKNYYNDSTLGFVILKNANEDLKNEIVKHPKTFLAYIFNTRPFITLDRFSTPLWHEKQLDIRNIQVKLKNGEFSNLVKYATDELKSAFSREEKINEIRKSYGNQFSLESYSFPQLVFTFNPEDYETNAFITFYSKYVKNYTTLIKALFDRSEEEDTMFKLLVKYYNNPAFSFFKDDKTAAKNIILIFEQNYGFRNTFTLPYDLRGKLIQDGRDFHIWFEEDIPKVDFNTVWDTLEKVLTPNNGYKYLGVCQNNQALAKRVFNTLLLPYVSFTAYDFFTDLKHNKGHTYSGIFLKNGIVTGKYLNDGLYRFTVVEFFEAGLVGLGDNVFGEISKKSGGSYVGPALIAYIDTENEIASVPSVKNLLEVINGDPDFKNVWDKFKGNYITTDMLEWMLKKGTVFIVFQGHT